MWFSNRKIASKLFLGFAAMLVLNAALGTFCLQKLAVVHETEQSLALRHEPLLQFLRDLRSSVGAHRHAQFEYLAARTEQERESCEKHLRDASTGIRSAREEYGSRISSPEQTSAFEEIKDDLAQYLAVSREAMELARTSRRKSKRRRSKSDKEPVILLFGEEESALGKVVSDLQNAEALNRQLSVAANSASIALYSSIRQQVGIGIALSAIAGLVLALGIGRIIVRPIRRVIAVARKIAACDLSGDMLEVNSRNEAGELAACMNEMQTSLREMLQAVANAARRLTSVTEPIAAASTRQVQAAGLQYQQMQQVAIAMQQTATATKEVSDKSSRAADTARQVAASADKSGVTTDALLTQILTIASAVGQTSKRIQELGKFSQQIGQFVSVIDDIASQTNLLALNAAIEAARAGEQGRGFAVVAGEVTQLAERTTRATKEIGLMIGQIQSETKNAVTAMSAVTSQAEAGVGATREAGDLLRSMIAASQELAGMVAHIAVATEQIALEDHITGDLECISKITKESAEDARQSTITVREISQLAAELRNLENRFQTSPKNSDSRNEEAYGEADSRNCPSVAQNSDRMAGRPSNGIALAARAVPHPGVARLNARLLDAETKPESQSRAPFAVSAEKPG